MTDNFIRADGKSPLSRYVDLLVSVPANLESVLDRNDELKTFLERLQPRRDQSPHDKCFRLAVDEARRDGTAAVICPKLEQVKIAYGRLITAARFVAQDDGGRADFDSAQIELGSLTCDLMNWLKSPASKITSAQMDAGDVHTQITENGGEANRSPENAVAHSTDFRSVRWFGTVYSFTSNQASVVRLLFDHWQAGTPDVGDETLLNSVDPEAPPARLNALFRAHPAWGTMIVSGGTKGVHRLSPPDV